MLSACLLLKAVTLLQKVVVLHLQRLAAEVFLKELCVFKERTYVTADFRAKSGTPHLRCVLGE